MDRWLGATEVSCAAPAQTSDSLLGGAQARQWHTVSGVCSQLKRKLAGRRVSDAFRQSRHGQKDRPAQQKASAKTGMSPVAAVTVATAPTQKATSAATGLPTSNTTVRSEKEHVPVDLALLTQHAQTEASQSSKQSLAASGTPSTSGKGQPAQLASAVDTSAEAQTAASLLNHADPVMQQQGASMLPSVTNPLRHQDQLQPQGISMPLIPTDSLPAADQLQQQGGSALPSVTDLLQFWSNPSIQPSSSKLIPDLPALLGAAFHTVVPAAITRSELQQGIALKQMENKFVAVVCNGGLCVMDQHAADERVRLEKLRAIVLRSQVGRCLVKQCLVLRQMRTVLQAASFLLLVLHSSVCLCPMLKPFMVSAVNVFSRSCFQRIVG